LREIPSTARVRGVFFNMISDHLKREGKQHVARRIVGGRRWLHSLYPVSEFLEATVAAAPHVHEDPDQAVRIIWSEGSQYFASTWLGRKFQRFIRPDPASALLWIENAREHTCNYGQWRLEHVSANHVVLHMFDEYIWIDSAHVGGCQGLLTACGVTGTVRASLDGLFNGRLDIRWTPRPTDYD
jgi:uncharacterized protein (TIGR02265 family)